MIRRLNLTWPQAAAAPARREQPIRLLAVSDQVESGLEFERNRSALEPLDGILGCGDLEPDYLAFLADAFRVPLLFVRGNHDRGANWHATRGALPRALDGRIEQLVGLSVAGLSWPGEKRGRAIRDELAAWQQALPVALRAALRRGPQIVISHVPPRGQGDTPGDAYHRGFAAYKWLNRRLQPLLWLHGHTALAATEHWRVDEGPTTLVNVTGAVMIELDTGFGRRTAAIGPE